ncbi:hypothetical protein FJY68_14380 [candidate division WOR-3 bacterium]|uniref:Uncharacterized protein n=1 Tax=candidate division WOR-3 bacterium TaxID=2052148 RepID=A0A937XH41_UNCW3|nr:hypothetical protein [candidate division WOR-3 bacterium]
MAAVGRSLRQIARRIVGKAARRAVVQAIREAIRRAVRQIAWSAVWGIPELARDRVNKTLRMACACTSRARCANGTGSRHRTERRLSETSRGADVRAPQVLCGRNSAQVSPSSISSPTRPAASWSD